MYSFDIIELCKRGWERAGKIRKKVRGNFLKSERMEKCWLLLRRRNTRDCMRKAKYTEREGRCGKIVEARHGGERLRKTEKLNLWGLRKISTEIILYGGKKRVPI